MIRAFWVLTALWMAVAIIAGTVATSVPLAGVWIAFVAGIAFSHSIYLLMTNHPQL